MMNFGVIQIERNDEANLLYKEGKKRPIGLSVGSRCMYVILITLQTLRIPPTSLTSSM